MAAQRRANIRIHQGIINRGPHITQFRPAIITPAGKLIGMNRLIGQQTGNRIGKLYLPAPGLAACKYLNMPAVNIYRPTTAKVDGAESGSGFSTMPANRRP